MLSEQQTIDECDHPWDEHMPNVGVHPRDDHTIIVCTYHMLRHIGGYVLMANMDMDLDMSSNYTNAL